MAASYNIEKSDHIEKTTIRKVIDKTNSNIEYDEMETKLHRFDNYNEEITYDDLAGLLSYAKQFTGDDASTAIIAQPDESSNIGPAEINIIADDVIATSSTKQVAAVEEHIKQNDDALDVTPTRGKEVTFPFWGLFVWLDPGNTPAIRAPPRPGILMRIISAVWRGVTRAVRGIRCFLLSFFPK